MENKEQFCFIWGDAVTYIQRRSDRDAFVVEGSPRIGGDYEISAQAIRDVEALDDVQKAKLTTMILEKRRWTGQTAVVTSTLIEKTKNADPLPIHERAERLLRYLVKIPKYVGQRFSTNFIQKDLRAFAWSESTIIEDIMYFLHYLTTQGWLERQNHSYMITVAGYQHIEEQATKKDLSQCFVAMWFDPSMDRTYEDGIKKAVEECGYKPLRIDKKPDVNKIDDEIIAEIRRARFVVADFTHDKEKGVRGGVYYEAGFAYGLGLKVIYSCRKGLERELNFDTRQYHHILWETPDDLCKQLRDRIRARVGDYKAKPELATL